jgi:hypothetical protein
LQRCSRDGDINESKIRNVVELGGFSIANFSYRPDAEENSSLQHDDCID